MRHSEWIKQATENGWVMPPEARWMRLPIIRRIRAFWALYRVERWYAQVPGIRTGYVEWVVYGIAHGLRTFGGRVPR